MTCWLSFVAEGRSGHTLLAALLDAHPNIRLAEEGRLVTRGLREGWTRDRIIHHIEQDGWGKEKRRFKSSAIGPLMSRRKKRVYVYGDKYGWECQRNDTDLYERFGRKYDFQTKVIAVPRNPYSHVASWYVSSKYKRAWGDGRFPLGIRRLARFYDKAQQVVDYHDALVIPLEAVIRKPRESLCAAADYLGVVKDEEWLSAACSVVWRKPRVKKVEWPPKYEEMVRWRLIDRFDLLERYRV